MTTTVNGTEPTTSGPHVTLGEHSYAVYPQRIGYLENRLGKNLARILDQQVSENAADGVSGFVGMLGGAAYDVLRVFVPRLMPEHEFRGYRSAEAMEAGDYDPEADASPSFVQIVEAFRVVMDVNRFDLFQHLGKIVGPELRQEVAALAIARATSTGTPSVIESSTTTPPTT